MHTLNSTLLHINIDLRYEPILFPQLILVGLVDLIIHLCCPNMYHASSYIGELAFTDLGLYRMLVCVASIIVISSHDMSAICFYDLLWYHSP